MPRSRFCPRLPALALGVTLVLGVVLVQNAKHAAGTREWAFSVVGAAVAEPARLSISEVARMHDAARDGNTALAVTLSERLEAALANGGGGPDRPVLLAYLGSAIALQARDGSGAMQKIVLTNRALRYLDEARELAPRSFAVLQITSGVQARLPGLFGRREQAVQDMLDDLELEGRDHAFVGARENRHPFADRQSEASRQFLTDDASRVVGRP